MTKPLHFYLIYLYFMYRFTSGIRQKTKTLLVWESQDNIGKIDPNDKKGQIKNTHMQDCFVPVIKIILLGASQKVFSKRGSRVSSIFQPFIWFWLRGSLGQQLQRGHTRLSPATSTSTRRHFQTSREI